MIRQCDMTLINIVQLRLPPLPSLTPPHPNRVLEHGDCPLFQGRFLVPVARQSPSCTDHHAIVLKMSETLTSCAVSTQPWTWLWCLYLAVALRSVQLSTLSFLLPDSLIKIWLFCTRTVCLSSSSSDSSSPLLIYRSVCHEVQFWSFVFPRGRGWAMGWTVASARCAVNTVCFKAVSWDHRLIDTRLG